MEIITCHLNADFDALASMMAAKKLYPHARIVFPGAQERSLREFFMRSALYALQVEKLKNLDLDKVTKLVVVDAKTPDRIGPIAGILGRPGLVVHVYDHHPPTAEDIKADFSHVEPLGACTTIFVELLRDRGVPISDAEATIMALGIYEETGSLVFASTTPRDIEAAAWLLRQGANLNIVSDFITRELDAEQVALLNDLLKSMDTLRLNGVKVAVCRASTRKYVQDLAVLAHKIRDMENLDALFCAVMMEDRVHLVARSRVDEVDAGAIAARFGGGGHPTAASATIKDAALDKVVERLMETLAKSVHPLKTARDFMTKPVMTVADTASVKEAGDAMTRYSVNVLPVVSEAGRLAGLISREVVQKALFHKLGERPVTEMMYTDFKTASPDTPFKTVEEIMIRRTQRFLPVTEDGGIVGAITRTDLLRALHEGLAEQRRVEEEVGAREDRYARNVRGLVEDKLPARTLSLLREVGRTADEMGVSAYAVGGFVRDLLLGVENLDLDIVVEGYGIPFAQAFARRYGARVRSHQKFGTAVVVLPDGTKFDIATARTEYYEYPAALPTVELGSIKKDLYRRDFTVNALAIKINARGFGELIDFFGGQRDIKEKTIRVLHNLSLIEDPTRAFRAVRFESRMDFAISKQTQSLIKNAVKMQLVGRLAGSRIFTELMLIFKETRPTRTVRRLEDFELLRSVHPKLRRTREMEALFSGAEETLSWFRLLFLDIEADTWLVFFMGLFDPLGDEEVEALAERMSVAERHMIKVRAARRMGAHALNEFYRAPRMRPYEVYTLLRPLPVEALLFMMAKARLPHAKKKVSQYLTQYRDVRPELSGDDLLAMGLQPGPVFKEILSGLLEGRLNGRIKTREDEEAFVADFLGRGAKAAGRGGGA